MVIVNGLNPGQTGFPMLRREDLSKVWGGSYGPDLVDTYVSGMKEDEVVVRKYFIFKNIIEGNII